MGKLATSFGYPTTFSSLDTGGVGGGGAKLPPPLPLGKLVLFEPMGNRVNANFDFGEPQIREGWSGMCGELEFEAGVVSPVSPACFNVVIFAEVSTRTL